MKRLLIGLGLLVLVGLAVLFALPAIVRVDRYRPWIVEQANAQLNGKLELGKLDLTVWGRLRIDVAGVRVLDAAGAEVVEVKQAHLGFPLLSLLKGEPSLVFVLEKPELTVVRAKEGKLNVATLAKASAPAPTPPADAGKADFVLPALVAKSRLSIELRDAQLSYADLANGLKTHVPELNVRFQDVSLHRPIQYRIWGSVDLSRKSEALTVRGPVSLEGTAVVQLAEGALSSATIQSTLTLSDLDLAMGKTFVKPKGVPLTAQWKLTATPQQIALERVVLQAANAEITAQGSVQAPPTSVLTLEVRSNEIDLAPWGAWIQGLKDLKLTGRARLEGSAQGPLAGFGYKGSLTVKDATVAAEGLKVPPTIQAQIDVVTDAVEKLSVTAIGPGSDLRVSGSVKGFAKPRVRLTAESKGMDLDQWVVFAPPSKTAVAAPAAAPPSGSKGSGAAKVAAADDRDALLAPLRTNAIARVTDAEIDLKFPRIKAKEVVVSDLAGKLFLKAGELGWQDLAFKVFDGRIRSRFALQALPLVPTYRFGAQVEGLDLKKAVESQLALFKNTLYGKLTLQMDGKGASLNTEPALKALSVKGGFKATEARFATIDVGKMVSESLNRTLEKVGDKVPQLKGKQLPTLPNSTSFYEFISCDFTVEGGRVLAPNFTAKSLPNAGVDVKGATTLGLIDDALDAHWELIDTHNQTKAYDLSPEVNGVSVPHILSENGAPIRIPVSAGCTLAAPCYNTTQVPEHFARVALANVGNALTQKAKDEAKKAAQQHLEKIIPQNAPPAVKGLGDALKKIW